MKHLSVILYSLLIVGCKNTTNSEASKTNYELKYPSEMVTENLKNLTLIDDAIHFFVIGDWGRQGYYNQAELGAMMNQISMVVEPEFVISTGDNFYDNGVGSVQDPLWKTSFEDIYSGNYLQIPWYIVLGNHDYRGNVQAQIDYSNISNRWTLPEKYWEKTIYSEDSPTAINLTFLDTTPLQDDYYSDVDYKDVVRDTDTISQLKWFKKTLTSIPSNQWNIVVGHHPMYTGGKRKNKKSYSKLHLEPYFDNYKVNAYFAGHEHHLQHIKPKGHLTHHIISGAGSEVRHVEDIEGTNFADSKTGIMVISILNNEMLVQAVDYKGNVLYKNKILK